MDLKIIYYNCLNHRHPMQDGTSVNLSFRRCWVRIWAGTPAIVTEIFRASSQSLHKIIMKVP
jgi:hypothetical protein